MSNLFRVKKIYNCIFKKALKMLEEIKDPEYTWFVNQSIQKCKEKNNLFFKLC